MTDKYVIVDARVHRVSEGQSTGLEWFEVQLAELRDRAAAELGPTTGPTWSLAADIVAICDRVVARTKSAQKEEAA